MRFRLHRNDEWSRKFHPRTPPTTENPTPGRGRAPSPPTREDWPDGSLDEALAAVELVPRPGAGRSKRPSEACIPHRAPVARRLGAVRWSAWFRPGRRRRYAGRYGCRARNGLPITAAGQSVSPPPPAGAEPVSSLGRIRRCGVFFRTAELGEVGCLTRVDVSPTVGVAEGAGGGTPGCPAVVPELRVHDAGDRDGGATGPAVRRTCTVDQARGPGHDQAAGGGGGAPGLDLLPHVPGDGHHGVPLERRGRWSTPSRSLDTRRPRRRSSTTGRRTR